MDNLVDYSRRIEWVFFIQINDKGRIVVTINCAKFIKLFGQRKIADKRVNRWSSVLLFF